MRPAMRRPHPAPTCRAIAEQSRAPWLTPILTLQIQHEILSVNGHEVNDHGAAVAAMDKAARWAPTLKQT